MKDENGIEINCENCRHCEYCDDKFFPDTRTTANSCGFLPSVGAYEARIAELQKELTVIQASERAEAQEADRLRGEVEGLEKKLTETIKLLSERARECGKLEALLEVKNRSDMSTQSTDAADVSKKIREMDMRNVWWR